MRLPLQIYPRLSPNVPAYQDTRGTGSVSASLSAGQSSFTEHWFIKDTNLGQFVQDVLGWSKKAGVRINRFLPAQHADLTFMWASRIASVEGYASTGQRPAAAGSTAAFKLVRVGVQYDTPPYRIASDGQVTKEYQRYIVPQDYDSNAEFIQRPKGAYVFYGAAPDGLANRTFGRPGEAGSSQILTKTKIPWLWVQLPDAGLFQGGFDMGRATQIEPGLGCVNAFDWHGYPAGTLLFESWKPTPQVLPVPPTTLGLVAGTVPRSWNALLTFVFFDPPPFDPALRGHNLVPHPTKPIWIMAKRQGGIDGLPTDRIYQQYDFDLLFTMV